ncbi:zinc-binding dehydrogenase [Streptomyces sp. NPDC048507]|uniref:zinc-binding dehydrogenase n=1 Tax=Streptomyces sp. NPDC048507 TaxID=3365560 RepID=UPI00371BDF61
MRGAVIHAPGDVRFETLEDPEILRPTDAIIRTAVTCVCGSDEELWPGLPAVSDVMGTGWWAAEAAAVTPGSTAVVVGDGAVGLCAVIAAKERGAEGVARIKEPTGGIGADSVLECVGTGEAMAQALHAARPGGSVGFVGVPHEVSDLTLPLEQVAEGYRAMDERRAVKALLRP